MDLDIDQVHQDTGKLLQEQSIVSDKGAGSASREMQMSLTRQSGSNEGPSLLPMAAGVGAWVTQETC
jgi:hypothetical protein